MYELKRIYVIRNEGTGHLKIGKASDPAKRLADLQVANACPLTLLASVPEDYNTEDHRRNVLEATAHVILRNSNVRGEWFAPTAEVCAFVDAIKCGQAEEWFFKHMQDEHLFVEVPDYLEQISDLEAKLAAANEDLSTNRALQADADRRMRANERLVRRVSAALADFHKEVAS